MANQTKELSTVGLIEAKAIELLRLHNPNLSFQGFADTGTATPNHTANYAWIVSESGTVFGETAVKGQVIWSDGSAWTVEKLTNILARTLYSVHKPNDIIIAYNSADFVSGGYLSADGSIATASASDGYFLNYIPVFPNSDYKYVGQLLDSARCIVFYDKDKNVVGYKNSSIVAELEFTTPEDAAYLRASCRTTYATTFKIEYIGINEAFAFVIPKELGAVKTILKNIAAIPEDVNSVYKASEWASLGYYGADGLLVSSTSSDSYQTAYVPIVENAEYKYTGQTQDVRSIVFYDRDKNIISTVQGAWGGSTEITFTTPQGAFYLRASCRTTAIFTFKIEYVGTEKEFAFVGTGELKVLADLLKSIVAVPNDVNSIYKALEWASSGYYNSDGSVASASSTDSYQTVYVPVVPNANYKYTGLIQDVRSIVFYDSAKQVIGSANVSLEDWAGTTEFEFTTPEDAAYLRSSCRTSAITTFKIEYVGSINSLAFAPAEDYDITTPEILYATDNDASDLFAREYIQYLFPESFIKQVLKMTINNSRTASYQELEKNVATKEDKTKTWELKGKGYKTKTGTFTIKKTKNSNAKDKIITALHIGDSVTASDAHYPDGTQKGGWGFPSIIREISLMDNEDHADDRINVIPIGTRNNQNRDFDYSGSTFTVRAFDEGKGSWCAATYLRHACLLVGDTGASDWFSANGYASWAALGLLTSEGVAYTATDAQKELIATTIFGAQAWDYDSNIWDWLQSKGGAGWTGGAGSYTGSAADNTAIDVAMNYIMDNPDNQFYSKTLAQTPASTTAFSLSAYLGRWKTLEDDGVTRLSVGSTAGSLITNINTYDVCMPSHIIIHLGENDRWHFAPTATRIKNDVKLIADSIRSEYASINIAIGITRMSGCFNPEIWSDIVHARDFNTSYNDIKFELQDEMKTELGNITTQEANKIYLLPTYNIQIPFGSFNRNAVSLLDLKEKLWSYDDEIHPGIISLYAIANQILSWIYYTL